jgi:hypothetical protein
MEAAVEHSKNDEHPAGHGAHDGHHAHEKKGENGHHDEYEHGHEHEPGHHHEHTLLVTVITPSGIYPEGEPERVKEAEIVAKLLAQAAHKLRLTNTTDWVAFVGERQINPELTFKENALNGTVEIEWHKPEGGGGTSCAF